jgi:hypothetical protein
MLKLRSFKNWGAASALAPSRDLDLIVTKSWATSSLIGVHFDYPSAALCNRLIPFSGFLLEFWLIANE